MEVEYRDNDIFEYVFNGDDIENNVYDIWTDSLIHNLQIKKGYPKTEEDLSLDKYPDEAIRTAIYNNLKNDKLIFSYTFNNITEYLDSDEHSHILNTVSQIKLDKNNNNRRLIDIDDIGCSLITTYSCQSKYYNYDMTRVILKSVYPVDLSLNYDDFLSNTTPKPEVELREDGSYTILIDATEEFGSDNKNVHKEIFVRFPESKYIDYKVGGIEYNDSFRPNYLYDYDPEQDRSIDTLSQHLYPYDEAGDNDKKLIDNGVRMFNQATGTLVIDSTYIYNGQELQLSAHVNYNKNDLVSSFFWPYKGDNAEDNSEYQLCYSYFKFVKRCPMKFNIGEEKQIIYLNERIEANLYSEEGDDNTIITVSDNRQYHPLLVEFRKFTGDPDNSAQLSNFEYYSGDGLNLPDGLIYLTISNRGVSPIKVSNNQFGFYGQYIITPLNGSSISAVLNCTNPKWSFKIISDVRDNTTANKELLSSNSIKISFNQTIESDINGKKIKYNNKKYGSCLVQSGTVFDDNAQVLVNESDKNDNAYIANRYANGEYIGTKIYIGLLETKVKYLLLKVSLNDGNGPINTNYINSESTCLEKYTQTGGYVGKILLYGTPSNGTIEFLIPYESNYKYKLVVVSNSFYKSYKSTSYIEIRNNGGAPSWVSNNSSDNLTHTSIMLPSENLQLQYDNDIIKPYSVSASLKLEKKNTKIVVRFTTPSNKGINGLTFKIYKGKLTQADTFTSEIDLTNTNHTTGNVDGVDGISIITGADDITNGDNIKIDLTNNPTYFEFVHPEGSGQTFKYSNYTTGTYNKSTMYKSGFICITVNMFYNPERHGSRQVISGSKDHVKSSKDLIIPYFFSDADLIGISGVTKYSKYIYPSFFSNGGDIIFGLYRGIKNSDFNIDTNNYGLDLINNSYKLDNNNNIIYIPYNQYIKVEGNQSIYCSEFSDGNHTYQNISIFLGSSNKLMIIGFNESNVPRIEFTNINANYYYETLLIYDNTIPRGKTGTQQKKYVSYIDKLSSEIISLLTSLSSYSSPSIYSSKYIKSQNNLKELQKEVKLEEENKEKSLKSSSIVDIKEESSIDDMRSFVYSAEDESTTSNVTIISNETNINVIQLRTDIDQYIADERYGSFSASEQIEDMIELILPEDMSRKARNLVKYESSDINIVDIVDYIYNPSNGVHIKLSDDISPFHSLEELNDISAKPWYYKPKLLIKSLGDVTITATYGNAIEGGDEYYDYSTAQYQLTVISKTVPELSLDETEFEIVREYAKNIDEDMSGNYSVLDPLVANQYFQSPTPNVITEEPIPIKFGYLSSNMKIAYHYDNGVMIIYDIGQIKVTIFLQETKKYKSAEIFYTLKIVPPEPKTTTILEVPEAYYKVRFKEYLDVEKYLIYDIAARIQLPDKPEGTLTPVSHLALETTDGSYKKTLESFNVKLLNITKSNEQEEGLAEESLKSTVNPKIHEVVFSSPTMEYYFCLNDGVTKFKDIGLTINATIDGEKQDIYSVHSYKELLQIPELRDKYNGNVLLFDVENIQYDRYLRYASVKLNCNVVLDPYHIDEEGNHPIAYFIFAKALQERLKNDINGFIKYPYLPYRDYNGIYLDKHLKIIQNKAGINTYPIYGPNFETYGIQAFDSDNGKIYSFKHILKPDDGGTNQYTVNTIDSIIKTEVKDGWTYDDTGNNELCFYVDTGNAIKNLDELMMRHDYNDDNLKYQIFKCPFTSNNTDDDVEYIFSSSIPVIANPNSNGNVIIYNTGKVKIMINSSETEHFTAAETGFILDIIAKETPILELQHNKYIYYMDCDPYIKDNNIDPNEVDSLEHIFKAPEIKWENTDPDAKLIYALRDGGPFPGPILDITDVKDTNNFDTDGDYNEDDESVTDQYILSVSLTDDFNDGSNITRTGFITRDFYNTLQSYSNNNTNYNSKVVVEGNNTISYVNLKNVNVEIKMTGASLPFWTRINNSSTINAGDLTNYATEIVNFISPESQEITSFSFLDTTYQTTEGGGSGNATPVISFFKVTNEAGIMNNVISNGKGMKITCDGDVFTIHFEINTSFFFNNPTAYALFATSNNLLADPEDLIITNEGTTYNLGGTRKDLYLGYILDKTTKINTLNANGRLTKKENEYLVRCYEDNKLQILVLTVNGQLTIAYRGFGDYYVNDSIGNVSPWFVIDVAKQYGVDKTFIGDSFGEGDIEEGINWIRDEKNKRLFPHIYFDSTVNQQEEEEELNSNDYVFSESSSESVESGSIKLEEFTKPIGTEIDHPLKITKNGNTYYVSIDDDGNITISHGLANGSKPDGTGGASTNSKENQGHIINVLIKSVETDNYKAVYTIYNLIILPKRDPQLKFKIGSNLQDSYTLNLWKTVYGTQNFAGVQIDHKNTENPRIVYSSSNPQIVGVDQSGNLSVYDWSNNITDSTNVTITVEIKETETYKGDCKISYSINITKDLSVMKEIHHVEVNVDGKDTNGSSGTTTTITTEIDPVYYAWYQDNYLVDVAIDDWIVHNFNFGAETASVIN